MSELDGAAQIAAAQAAAAKAGIPPVTPPVQTTPAVPPTEKPGESQKDPTKPLGVSKPVFPVLDKAENLLKQLEEKETQLTQRELQLTEKIKQLDIAATEMRLSGMGHVIPELTQEEKDIEAAKNLLKGTGFEDMAFPPPKK